MKIKNFENFIVKNIFKVLDIEYAEVNAVKKEFFLKKILFDFFKKNNNKEKVVIGLFKNYDGVWRYLDDGKPVQIEIIRLICSFFAKKNLNKKL